MQAILPPFLKPAPPDDLIRLGRDNDGGYLVSRADVERSRMLLSFGINDDWSFESDFCARNDVPLVAYDASVGEGHFRRQFTKHLFQFDKPSRALRSGKAWRSFRRFFSGQRRHVPKYVGLDHGPAYVTMSAALQDAPAEGVFFKVDIEGFEYRVLEDLLDAQQRMSGLAIEFHDCDLHLDRIRRFVERLSLKLVHVHANNYAPLSGPAGVPLVLELSFSRHAAAVGAPRLPHPLDMPNDPGAAEVVLGFAAEGAG